MLITCLVKDVKIEKSNEQKQTQEQKSISNTPSPSLPVSQSPHLPVSKPPSQQFLNLNFKLIRCKLA